MDKITRVNTIFPWWSGLSSDLLFWVAIDTLFLTLVKGFNSSQIVSMTTISLITSIIFQVPMLKIIRKIGNTYSMRLGSFMLLLASIVLTFGNSYLIILLGKIFYNSAFTFQNMENVILKNNLELKNKENEYIKIKTKANTIYSVVTMIISFVATVLFNINNYLPMLLCILFCFICFLLSFYIKDFSGYDKIKEDIREKKVKIKYSKLIIIMILAYSLFYPIVNSGQSNGKLFIQEELFTNFNVEQAALIIGAILCVSRIVRVISNIIFNKAYKKYREKIGIILSSFLVCSFVFIIVGSFVKEYLLIKYMLMTLGYIIILFIRDPYKVYMQDLLLKNSEKKYQQNLLASLELTRKIIRAILGIGFTFVLINNSMLVVMIMLLILAIVQFFVNIKVYKLI